MQPAECPTCHVLVQTLQGSRDEDLLGHITASHVLPSMETMLYMTSVEPDVRVLLEVTKPLCAGCRRHVAQDNGIYHQTQTRTQLCCSTQCLALAQSFAPS